MAKSIDSSVNGGVIEKRIQRRGRVKIEIKKIDNINRRQVTFSKRRAGLFKKANQLAVLCDAQVGVFVFSSTGKLYEFASPSMDEVLARYTGAKNINFRNNVTGEISEPQASEMESNLVPHQELMHSPMLGKEVEDKKLRDLELLEHQSKEEVSSVKEKKGKGKVNNPAEPIVWDDRMGPQHPDTTLRLGPNLG